MNTKKSTDLPEVKSSTNVKIRSKKLPPPPLSLPLASNTIPNEDKCSNSNQQIVEQKKSTSNCSLSSSSRECSHELIPYILPIGQRSQILETLVNSSSSLLIQPSSSSETKQKRSQLSLNTNQINFLKQRQALRQNACNDTEWLDFIRCILYKPLETELKILLDKYKMTYFDRINSPNIQDATIRTILCDMVSQVLTTYSNSASTSSSLVVENNIPINVSSSTYSNTNGSLKRKRYDQSSTIIINNQTKFVISYIIPDKCDDITNSNKLKYQQQQQQQQRNKQFQKKYSHLFKYIPDKDEQTYLIREGYLKNQILCCLMLYDEILAYMNQDDIELSGISIDNSFTLSESIITHINLSIQ